MKQRPRIYYTENQKALMWERWRKGESLQNIAQLFDRNHSSIQGILAESGGIQPAQRRRSRLALTLTEREEISRSVATGQSIRSVATRLGRAPSTISREIMRNGGQECSKKPPPSSVSASLRVERLSNRTPNPRSRFCTLLLTAAGETPNAAAAAVKLPSLTVFVKATTLRMYFIVG